MCERKTINTSQNKGKLDLETDKVRGLDLDSFSGRYGFWCPYLSGRFVLATMGHNNVAFLERVSLHQGWLLRGVPLYSFFDDPRKLILYWQVLN